MSYDWGNKISWLPSSQQGDSAYILVQEYGKMVMIFFMGRGDKSYSDDEVLFTVPDAYKPITDSKAVGCCGNNTMVITLRTNGQCIIWKSYAGSTATRLHFTMIYVRA